MCVRALAGKEAPAFPSLRVRERPCEQSPVPGPPGTSTRPARLLPVQRSGNPGDHPGSPGSLSSPRRGVWLPSQVPSPGCVLGCDVLVRPLRYQPPPFFGRFLLANPLSCFLCCSDAFLLLTAPYVSLTRFPLVLFFSFDFSEISYLYVGGTFSFTSLRIK